ncbi:MAG: DNA sulfur modification protein DndD [Desulfobulbaceae bacterium]|nr:DNA sulfur modification protein DndD [Desulfobulbaceae bacterium]
MWISKLELINFKSYQHQVFEFPAPYQNKNVILIGGMNGYGKTTILEALYMGLYGKDSIIHLARAGIKGETGYPIFLERALHGQAIRTRRDTMSVTVQFNTNDHEGFQVTRKWFFAPNGDWNDEEILIYDIRDGIRTQTRNAEQIEEILDQHFVPAHLAPFFFFDGEEVKRLADHNRVEQIKMGMEGLLGVVLLRKLETRLQQYQTNKSQGVPKVDEDKHRQLFEELTQHEQQLEETQHKKILTNGELDNLKTERSNLMHRIMALGGGGGDIANARDIVEQVTRAEIDLKKCQDELEQVLGSRLSFHLISQKIRDTYLKQLRAEEERIKWDTRKNSLEPDRDKFVTSFFAEDTPEFRPELTDTQQSTVVQRLQTAWESLFYPLPDGCAEEIIHDYIHGAKRQQVIGMMENLSIGAQDILGLLERRDTLQEKIRNFRNRLAKIEGIDRDGTLAALNTEMRSFNDQIDKMHQEVGSLEKQISTLQVNINNERSNYQREHEKFLKANPVKSDVARAERVCMLIKELIPSLYALKTERLGAAMTSVFQRLSHKKQVARIEIDETGKSRLISYEGDEITFDKSAGEDQLFATALLAGLAEVSGLHAPLVVDTPLARLDSQHRKNILNYWISDKSRQVFLLSQDKEIDAQLFNELEDYVAQTYLLQNQQIGSGVGKTVATKDAYFGGQ